MENTNFEIISGDSFQVRVTYKNSSGSTVNLNGYDVIMKIKDQTDGVFLCASATWDGTGHTGNGISVISASGIIDINLTSSQTALFDVPESSYQLRITSGSYAKTLLRGIFNVDPGVIN
mgnify:CR=1 FL=1